MTPKDLHTSALPLFFFDLLLRTFRVFHAAEVTPALLEG